MFCSCANAPIKEQHVLLRALFLLLSSLSPCCWAPPLPGPPRQHRDWADWTSLDIAESMVVLTDSPPRTSFPGPLGFFRLYSFFFFLVSSPHCHPCPTSDSRFTKIKFIRLHSIWLSLRLNLFSWGRIETSLISNRDIFPWYRIGTALQKEKSGNEAVWTHNFHVEITGL